VQSELGSARSDNDSLVAQAIADREGPRVSIRATFEPAAGSRRIRANFHADDDAYVIVGHIDPDGVLRIAFPDQPGDDGFVKGNHSYQTTEFFAGFDDQYNYRLRSGMLYRSTAAETDSYDRGLGYVFIIATWRPMRFERFQTDGEWDSFELADRDYLRDPRPAVYELASLLSGDNREAYTVQFARYYNTQTVAGGYDSFASEFGYGATSCPGYAVMGYSSPFFSNAGYINRYSILNDESFWYRGTYYQYDQLGDCYRQGGYYAPYGYNPFGVIAQTPLPPGSRPRGFSLDNHRGPIEPQPTNKVHAVLATPTAGSTPATSPSKFSPAYRQRGLITEETEPVVPRGRRNGVQAVGQAPEGRSRPGFSEMVNRRGIDGNEGTPTYRTRARVENGSSNNGWNTQPRPRYEPTNSGANGETRSRFNPSDNPRSAPTPRESAPRFEAPTRVSSPPPSAPPPRMEPPRVESRPVSAPPASAPPASSSGAPIKPPGK
jgi:hypothetical protein